MFKMATSDEYIESEKHRIAGLAGQLNMKSQRMNGILNKLFPQSANNDFRGHKIALWGFKLSLLMTWRSIIHMFFEQYGFHEIANFSMIAGDPDPMILIYRFFSMGFCATNFLLCLLGCYFSIQSTHSIDVFALVI